MIKLFNVLIYQTLLHQVPSNYSRYNSFQCFLIVFMQIGGSWESLRVIWYLILFSIAILPFLVLSFVIWLVKSIVLSVVTISELFEDSIQRTVKFDTGFWSVMVVLLEVKWPLASVMVVLPEVKWPLASVWTCALSVCVEISSLLVVGAFVIPLPFTIPVSWFLYVVLSAVGNNGLK